MAKITSYYELDTCWAFISIAATKSKHKIVRGANYCNKQLNTFYVCFATDSKV